ncbi:hypothetical protein [uncultured Algoriphagus sp.]|uniref:hypothetical protein n=1 Tax=uncultured Algoriphagus sp. TaxID=417365 RepID=UPI0030EEFD69|tara:strand:+ start:72050 stop:72730 length:681 start_codon:yes stop_codon:yes gene_type:complete
MKEYSPKPDLWSKIQQRKDFDSQVKEHIPNLPVKMPKADLWDAIEKELDQKTPIIPLWKYGMAAAAIALILAFSGIAYFELGEKEAETQLITEVSLPPTEIETINTNPKAKTESENLKPDLIKAETPILSKPIQSSTLRETITPIETPELNLADLSIENTFVSELIILPAPEIEPPKTLHQVTISWSKIKPKMQITTGFGRQESELNQKQQASADQKAQVTIDINN